MGGGTKGHRGIQEIAMTRYEYMTQQADDMQAQANKVNQNAAAQYKWLRKRLDLLRERDNLTLAKASEEV